MNSRHKQLLNIRSKPTRACCCDDFARILRGLPAYRAHHRTLPNLPFCPHQAKSMQLVAPQTTPVMSDVLMPAGQVPTGSDLGQALASAAVETRASGGDRGFSQIASLHRSTFWPQKNFGGDPFLVSELAVFFPLGYMAVIPKALAVIYTITTPPSFRRQAFLSRMDLATPTPLQTFPSQLFMTYGTHGGLRRCWRSWRYGVTALWMTIPPPAGCLQTCFAKN